MATLPNASSTLSRPLHDIAELFLVEWQRSHGRSGQQACASLTGDTLTVTIEHALTEGEMRLAANEPGRDMVRRYIIQLVNEIYPQLAAFVERSLGCFVAASDVDVNSEEGSVCFCVHLRDLRRAGLRVDLVQSCVVLSEVTVSVG